MAKYFVMTNAAGQQEFGSDNAVPKGAVEVARMPKDFEKWAGSNFVFDSSAADKYFCNLVKAIAEKKKMKFQTESLGKMREYAAKKQEVVDYLALGNALNATLESILPALSTVETAKKSRTFTWALADAAAHGDSVAAAIGRFQAGMSSSDTVVAQIAGIEQAACKRIKAASTYDSKRAEFNSIAWPAGT